MSSAAFVREPIMLEARSLTKKYGDAVALDALELRVDAGQIVALVGANGAGKTTTLSLFLGFVEPSSGEARVDDRCVADHPQETKKHLAYIPERLALYPSLSGLENLDYFHGLSEPSLPKAELLGFLREAGLEESVAVRRVSTYSKGMSQKVGIALALAKRATSLLLDEPLSGLDPKAANDFCMHLSKLREAGAAILMATHDLFRARETADRIGIMRAGKLVSDIVASEVTYAELERVYLEHMR